MAHRVSIPGQNPPPSTTGNYIVQTIQTPTPAQKRILRLLGFDVTNAAKDKMFIAPLTPNQVELLKAEKWVRYVEPERLSYTTSGSGAQ